MAMHGGFGCNFVVPLLRWSAKFERCGALFCAFVLDGEGIVFLCCLQKSFVTFLKIVISVLQWPVLRCASFEVWANWFPNTLKSYIVNSFVPFGHHVLHGAIVWEEL
jgi:uncharacterized protein YqhQ